MAARVRERRVRHGGQTRDEAIGRLAGALDEFTAEGIKHTAPFCARIIRSDRFKRGDLDTNMIGEYLPKAS